MQTMLSITVGIVWNKVGCLDLADLLYVKGERDVENTVNKRIIIRYLLFHTAKNY